MQINVFSHGLFLTKRNEQTRKKTDGIDQPSEQSNAETPSNPPDTETHSESVTNHEKM